MMVKDFSLNGVISKINKFYPKDLISFYDYPIQKRNLIEIKFLKTHSGEIKCFDISNDGKFVLTGSNDTVVRVWDFVERKQISCFFGH